MGKILFIYNDYNDVKGISSAMRVAEGYALSSGKGKFWVNSKPNPSINFESGETISVLPVTKGIPPLGNYDEVYMDDTINTFIEISQFSTRISYYDENGIKG